MANRKKLKKAIRQAQAATADARFATQEIHDLIDAMNATPPLTDPESESPATPAEDETQSPAAYSGGC